MAKTALAKRAPAGMAVATAVATVVATAVVAAPAVAGATAAVAAAVRAAAATTAVVGAPTCSAATRTRKFSSAGRSCRSEEYTYELQSLMRISYVVICMTKQNT